MGNDLYGDDAVGLEVVRRLRCESAAGDEPLSVPEETDFTECSLSGLALLDIVVGYDSLLIVDTIKKPQPQTGRLRILDAADLRSLPGPSPHYISVPQMIEIGLKLGLHVPSRIRVVAVEARNIHQLGEGLSEEMLRRLPRIIRRVKAELRNVRSEE